MIHRTFVMIGLAAALGATSACRSEDAGGRVDTEVGAQDRAAAEAHRGPHGGRLLADGDFGLEITIFEAGVPPEFRVYAFENGTPLDPARVDLTIVLHRFGGRVDTIRFAQRHDYLAGDRVVEEPHSFDVEVKATSEGRTVRWEYASYEGRTEISPEAVKASGIVIETAGPATVRTALRLHGRVAPNGDRLAHITPRYPGVVREARKRLGERVARGEVLAVVESNESLRPYELPAPIAGTVIEKDATPGEFVDGTRTIYAVADLSTVWVDLAVYQQDLPRLEVGQTVRVSARDERRIAQGKIVYVSPVGSERTQTLLARAELPNPDVSLRPGLFVTGEVTVDEAAVPVAVRTGALQTFRDWDVVFLTDGHVFQAMPVEIGRRDDEWAAIHSGVQAGQRYAAEGSFVVKADIGKSGATHEH